MGWDRKGNGNEVGWVDPCVEKIQNILCLVKVSIKHILTLTKSFFKMF